MKSCLGLLFILFIFTLVVGGGALIWYLSGTAEFSRNNTPPAAASGNPPRATPVHPSGAAPGRPPVAIPVRPPVKR